MWKRIERLGAWRKNAWKMKPAEDVVLKQIRVGFVGPKMLMEKLGHVVHSSWAFGLQEKSKMTWLMALKTVGPLGLVLGLEVRPKLNGP